MIGTAYDFAFKWEEPLWLRIAILVAVLVAMGIAIFAILRKR